MRFLAVVCIVAVSDIVMVLGALRLSLIIILITSSKNPKI
jgi:hypothetical protein